MLKKKHFEKFQNQNDLLILSKDAVPVVNKVLRPGLYLGNEARLQNSFIMKRESNDTKPMKDSSNYSTYLF